MSGRGGGGKGGKRFFFYGENKIAVNLSTDPRTLGNSEHCYNLRLAQN